ncbi:MAG: galactokinase [Prevotella sp.]|nr:galactokinase [Prevotella sp.]MBO5627207.1 galactokinase [Prevotella sp.]
MTVGDVRNRFKMKFNGAEGNVYAAPGRINLIGEHTDYNGGYVFPGAVDKGMIAEVKPNGTNKVRAFAVDLYEDAEFDLNDLEGPKASWARYIYGICREMQERGVDVKGFDTAFSGDVPLGSGMSSSAALESCYAFAINDLFGNNKVEKVELAKAGQATEHKYIGVNCGIMDQFASVFGKKGYLIRLNCHTMDYSYFPFDPQGYCLVLLNSCVKHELASSAYNDRRRSCETVFELIKDKYTNVPALSYASIEMLNEVKSQVTEEDYLCAKYVIEERDRVLGVSEALSKGDYALVGQLMYQTHKGLSQDYKVSCPELDYLNEIAYECGVTGSRMMGGGFGGCTINLVKQELYDAFIETAKNKYKERYGVSPLVYDVVIGDGARKIL